MDHLYVLVKYTCADQVMADSLQGFHKPSTVASFPAQAQDSSRGQSPIQLSPKTDGQVISLFPYLCFI